MCYQLGGLLCSLPEEAIRCTNVAGIRLFTATHREPWECQTGSSKGHGCIASTASTGWAETQPVNVITRGGGGLFAPVLFFIMLLHDPCPTTIFRLPPGMWLYYANKVKVTGVYFSDYSMHAFAPCHLRLLLILWEDPWYYFQNRSRISSCLSGSDFSDFVWSGSSFLVFLLTT